MSGPTLRLLGGFMLADAGMRPLVLPGRKARMLLAYAALNAPRPVTRERLAGLLWDERDDRQARHSLRQCLMELRRLGERAGGDLVRADKEAVVLALPVESVDALTVEWSAGQGTAEALSAAAALCTGALLPEAGTGTEACDTWLAGERARFARLAAGIFARLVALSEAQGNWGEAQSAAERWLVLDPACEEAHRSLMRLHARSGRRSDAIRQYHACAAAVRRCLDAEPEEETTELLHSIRDGPASMASRTRVDLLEPERVPERREVPERPSLAVLPFATLGGPAECGGLADGLAHDILVRLARFRSLFVIARGSSFRFRGAQIDPCTVGGALGVRYLITGAVRIHAGRLRLTVELIEAETGNAVWGDVIERRLDDMFVVQEELAARVVAALAIEIEATEMRRAMATPPPSLDAWGAHHRGLWHMFRFTRADNETARGFFQQALRLDPLYARSLAGLSFTHFQDAFLHRTGDRKREADLAYRLAEQSVALDERDATTHLALGRALWLLERQDAAVEELGVAVDLNPNFALAHYSMAFVQSQGGDALEALRAAELAQRLSPFDPLLFGMLGARALAYLNVQDYAQAAMWGERAARRPNAHVHIQAIAAFSDALAERHDEARGYAHRIKEAVPSYRCGDFLAAFRILPSVAELIRRAGSTIGIPP